MEAIRQAGGLQRVEYISAGYVAVQQRSCLLQGVQCNVLQGISMSRMEATGTGDCLLNLAPHAHALAGAVQLHYQAAGRAGCPCLMP